MHSKNKRSRRYHTLPQHTLERLWNEEGDEEAEGVLEDRKIIRDLASNPQTEFLPHFVPLGPRLWLLFRKANNGRLGIWLELPENLAVDRIINMLKEHRGAIRQWKDFLREWQGPNNGVEKYVNRLHGLNKEGISQWLQMKLSATFTGFATSVKSLIRLSQE